MDGLTLQPSVMVDGHEWLLFTIEFDTADGRFSTHIYALSHEHACMVLEELKATARVAGQVSGFSAA